MKHIGVQFTYQEKMIVPTCDDILSSDDDVTAIYRCYVKWEGSEGTKSVQNSPKLNLEESDPENREVSVEFYDDSLLQAIQHGEPYHKGCEA